MTNGAADEERDGEILPAMINLFLISRFLSGHERAKKTRERDHSLLATAWRATTTIMGWIWRRR
jgi:hypothetical protein